MDGSNELDNISCDTVVSNWREFHRTLLSLLFWPLSISLTDDLRLANPVLQPINCRNVCTVQYSTYTTVYPVSRELVDRPS